MRRRRPSGRHILSTCCTPLYPPFVTKTLATSAPSAASCFAIRAQLPREPPMSSATLPASSLIVIYLPYLSVFNLANTTLLASPCFLGMVDFKQMELRNLRYFVAVAETLKFTKVAE